MKRSGIIVVLATLSAIGLAVAAKRGLEHRLPNVTDSTGAITLPNGWRITPAGTHIQLPGDLPMKMQTIAGSSQLIVNTGGYHDHSLNVIDTNTRKIAATLDVAKTWDGMAFDPQSGTVYLSGGGKAGNGFVQAMARLGLTGLMSESVDKPILRVRWTDGKLTPMQPVKIAGLQEKDRFISGVTLGPTARYTCSTSRPTPSTVCQEQSLTSRSRGKPDITHMPRSFRPMGIYWRYRTGATGR